VPLGWLSLAILCTVAYHLVLKLTPAGVHPLLSLMVTYALVTLLFGAALLVAPAGFEWRQELRQLNWTALALAVAIVGLDLGFLYLYRGGFDVSLRALVTQSAAAMLLARHRRGRVPRAAEHGQRPRARAVRRGSVAGEPPLSGRQPRAA
jgi:hypothetical protein